MIGRLAMRSLTAHPVRSAVLAAGFGIGVGVMAILLGVAEIVLDQARAQRRWVTPLAVKTGSRDVVEQAAIAGALAAGILGEPNRAIEAAHQLRGEAESRQVKDAKIALCHGTGGYLSGRHSGVTMLLGRD